MIKRILGRVVERMPGPVRNAVRNEYWRIKSKLLYEWLFGILGLEYRLQSGVMVKVASQGEWWTYNDIFVNHEYDVAIQTALAGRRNDRPFIVLDLGANVGYFLLRVVDLIRQGNELVPCDVTLVEGSPSNFKRLRDRLAAQPLEQVSCNLVHGLVGVRAGRGVIQESAIHVKNTILHEAGSRGATVEFVDLNTVMEQCDRIDLLKCDIEGAEQLFLENYPDLLRKVNTAVFEFHHHMCDTSKCTGILVNSGFQQHDLRRNDEVSICLFSRPNPNHRN